MKNLLATLAFYAKHPELCSFDRRCETTVKAVRTLESLGFLRVNWTTHQAQFTGKVFADIAPPAISSNLVQPF